MVASTFSRGNPRKPVIVYFLPDCRHSFRKTYDVPIFGALPHLAKTA